MFLRNKRRARAPAAQGEQADLFRFCSKSHQAIAGQGFVLYVGVPVHGKGQPEDAGIIGVIAAFGILLVDWKIDGGSGCPHRDIQQFFTLMLSARGVKHDWFKARDIVG